jgi:hypothetical protein
VGLVASEGQATVSAHHFRHTVGTQLAEKEAKSLIIMQVMMSEILYYFPKYTETKWQ